jgi:hypothetical protein
MIVNKSDDKVAWTFSMQDPVKLLLDRWYKNNADGCVHVEHSTTGIITVTISHTGRLKLEEGMNEEMFKSKIPKGEWGMVDVNLNVLLFDSKNGFKHDLWGYVPPLQSKEADDFRAYLAADYEGKFLTCYGTNRNLPLILFAQCRTAGLRCDREQTEFGRAIAVGLILHRWGLPQISQYNGAIQKDLLFKRTAEIIKDESMEELRSLSTADIPDEGILPDKSGGATQPVLLGESGGSLRKECGLPEEEEPSIELEYLMSVGLSGYEEDIDFPVKIDFSHYAAGTGIFPGVTDMFMEGPLDITILASFYSKETCDMLACILAGYKFKVVAPGSTSYFDLTQSPEFEEVSG